MGQRHAGQAEAGECFFLPLPLSALRQEQAQGSAVSSRRFTVLFRGHSGRNMINNMLHIRSITMLSLMGASNGMEKSIPCRLS